jgi:hypothetical protein
MADDEAKPAPRLSAAATAAARRRDERLAAALKANLHRRKRQVRGRDEAPGPRTVNKPEGDA